ncbi:MAG: DUF1456 family protein [Desulfamplus sp.]|nr:DUF1456 family protein [Desulfamplus sp.]
MENNDVLRMFRYALNISDNTMINIFTIAKCRIDKPQLLNLLKKKDEQGYVACSTTLLEHFFNGLIIYNRGSESDSSDLGENYLVDTDGSNREREQRNTPLQEKIKQPESLNNNLILKKIRIALDLKQDDMMEIFRLGKVSMTKGEFTALFRKEGHKNYKECGDQYLRKFLQGLAIRHKM